MKKNTLNQINHKKLRYELDHETRKNKMFKFLLYHSIESLLHKFIYLLMYLLYVLRFAVINSHRPAVRESMTNY